jgi:hypothetical protein
VFATEKPWHGKPPVTISISSGISEESIFVMSPKTI